MLCLTTEVLSLTSPDGENSPSTEPSVSDNGPGAGRPKGTTKLQKKQENVNNLKCIEAIVLEYSSQASAAKSVRRKVDYGYLDKLIDAKKSEFNVKREISKKQLRLVYTVVLPPHHIEEQNLHWKRLRPPLCKFAFRWGNFANP